MRLLSTSTNASAGTWKVHAVSSAIDWLPTGVPTTGASLTGVTVSLNVSEALNEPSLATTVRSNVSVAFAGGVPEKVRVSASNVSHGGRADPSDRVAV